MTPSPDNTFDLIRGIRRTLVWLVAATALLWLVVGAVTTLTYLSSLSVNDTLCDVRADFEDRIERSQQFLIDHPDGLGEVTPAMIQQGLDAQRRTVAAMSNLDC